MKCLILYSIINKSWDNIVRDLHQKLRSEARSSVV
jgi:hypothetical protein